VSHPVGIHLGAQAQRTDKTESMEINTNPLHVQSEVDIFEDCTRGCGESGEFKGRNVIDKIPEKFPGFSHVDLL
jgi:hypothetical protein